MENRARNQFILLGILCQSLTWDGYSIPLLYLACWFTALRVGEKRITLPGWSEAALLVAGCVAGYLLGKSPGQTSHFFIGHGITWLQLSRMLRPLVAREKMFSIMAACVHIGVGCTVVLDFRFLFILLGAVVLIPRTLAEFHLQEAGLSNSGRSSSSPSMSWASYAIIFVIMIAIFLGFPRAAIGSPLQSQRIPDTQEGTLVDSILDPTRSSLAQSGRTILQVEGKNLGLLRSFALVDFDGTRWVPDTKASLRRIRQVMTNEVNEVDRRRVRVKSVNFLGRVLPCEGAVANLSGKFFRRPLQSYHNTLECESMWNTANNMYEYWLDPTPARERIPPGMMLRMTNHPPVSPKLANWIEERVTGAPSLLDEARRLESYLKDNFTYELGAPVLKRLNALEQFLFVERRGHCERYASAMALLMRMRGIPSRVMIGYLPSNRSMFSGWINIRFKDAHAWCEGYFPGQGWVQFDATPRSRQPTTGLELRDVLDALDLAWFMNVVSFDGAMQRDLFVAAIKTAQSLGEWMADHRKSLLSSGLVVTGVAGLLYWFWRFSKSSRGKRVPPAEVRASHYYAQMLRLLGKAGVHREPSLTPQEFESKLHGMQWPSVSEVSTITRTFCLTRYGGKDMSQEEETATQQALVTLKQHLGMKSK